MPLAAPVGMPMLAAGQRCHHASTVAVSVLASWKPCSVCGLLPLQGKTGRPRPAYSSAASTSSAWSP